MMRFQAERSMWTLILVLVMVLVGDVLSSQTASAAEVVANAQPVQVAVGGSAEIAIDLVLAPGEDASVFEGFFDLIGDGTVIVAVDDADLIPGGPTWDTALGSAGNQLSIVSLTSSNEGGARLVGRLTVVGQQPGTFELRLGAGTFASRDVPPPEFAEEVPITTPVGTVLATVQVAGVPSVPGVGSFGLGIVSILLVLTGLRSVRRVDVIS
ncbi:MAG: hypothetical protein ACX98W_11450 [bacterium]